MRLLRFLSLLITGTLYVGRALGRSVPDDDVIMSDDPGLDEPWLADFDGGNSVKYADFLDRMQADAPSPGDDASTYHRLQEWVCPPPPPAAPPSHLCTMTECGGDRECGEGKGNRKRCCFNGCVKTCLNTLPPPPLVDWMKEPPRRLLAGNSWLVGGPESLSQGGKNHADSCSTDFDPDMEDALLCSHGYICHILYPGDKERGIPNRGRCLKEENDDGGSGHRYKFRLATAQNTDNADESVCVFENAIVLDGKRFMYQNHECECLKSTITCTVGDDTLD